MVEIDENLIGKEVLEMAFDRCIKCSTRISKNRALVEKNSYLNRTGHQVESELYVEF